MKITSLYIENFGCLHAYRLTPSAGLNVICEDNGFGKTTLAAFIRAMFYGLPVTRRSDLDENERRKYQPWQGGAWGGTISFTANGKSYRAERFFAAPGSRKTDTFVLYDTETNLPSDDYDASLGTALFGVDADGFTRSAFLPQKLVLSGTDNASISARLNRVMDTGEETGNYDRAVSVLEKERQIYKKTGNRGRIAELEGELVLLREREEECLSAGARAEALTADAAEVESAILALCEERAALERHKEALERGEAQAARLAHGRTLLSERDRLVARAAEKRRFLDPALSQEELSALLAAADADASEAAVTAARLEDHRTALAATEEQCHALDADMRIPDTAAAEEIRAAAEALRFTKERALKTQTAGTENEADPTVYDTLLSEAELDRHTKQAAMYVSETAVLVSPMTAEAERQAAYEASGFAPTASLPDEEMTDRYAGQLQALTENRAAYVSAEKTLSEDRAALDALLADGKTIPEEQTLVAVRTRYDGLYAKKCEIDGLEEKQHAAAAARAQTQKSKRHLLVAGGILMLVGVVFIGLYFGGILPETAILLASLVPMLTGASLVLIGLLSREDADARVLDDDIFKRLCSQKSEYETDKTAVYEFLDACAGHAVLDAEEAERIFAEAATASRQRETLRASIAHTEEEQAERDKAAASIREALASLREQGIMCDTEDMEVFADYRAAVRRCHAADARAAAERTERARSRARADALSMTLNAYLGQLASSPAAGAYTPPADTEDYFAVLSAWRDAAGTYRLQQQAEQQAKAAVAEAEAALCILLNPYLSEDAAPTTPAALSDGAAKLLAKAAERDAHRRSLADTKARLQTQIASDGAVLAAANARLEAFLSRFFDAPYPAAADGIAVVAETRRTLADDMEELRARQSALQEFLAEADIAEDTLRETAAPDDDAESLRASLREKLAAMDDRITAMRDEMTAMRLEAEQASAAASVLPAIRDEIAGKTVERDTAAHRYDVILKTRTFLDEAKSAMSVRYLGVMQRSFRQYYATLTGISAEEAEALTLDEHLQPQLEIGGVRREEGYFSRGTGDLIHLCIRLALIDALYADGAERPPLILDDPFVNLDRARLDAARALLDRAAETYQIFYTVCHESRA